METPARGPFQDEAERVKDHTYEVYHMGMVEAVQDRDLSTNLVKG